MKPVFTVIVPVYNEKDCLEELYRRVKQVMEQTKEAWELVLVDDGSTDGSTEIIRKFGKEDSHVRPVIFARNYGHQLAVTAGMDYSRGDAVLVIDADLQDPPEVMLDLIAKWREGFQVVYAVRAEREGESKFKLLTASLFYRLIYRITDVKIPMDTGDFRLLDRKVVDTMNGMRERQRFLRGMSAWVGFRQVGVPYKRFARYAGSTKYPLKKMIKLAMTAITSFSYFPLQLSTWAGTFLAGIAFVLMILFIILRAVGSTFLAGQALTVVLVVFLGGIQLISLGILGEYIGRIYDEVKGRPLYTTSEAPSDEK
ncbi:putative glycosyltransferase [bioreactor metagenome]|uniref:Putative glycosyltransferase n=1 Tax=bioreactor metagenome TaxID=1076179 RepID=A0A644YJ78_9ZZZZ